MEERAAEAKKLEMELAHAEKQRIHVLRIAELVVDSNDTNNSSSICALVWCLRLPIFCDGQIIISYNGLKDYRICIIGNNVITISI